MEGVGGGKQGLGAQLYLPLAPAIKCPLTKSSDTQIILFFQVIKPGTNDHYDYCNRQKRFHVPLVVYITGMINHLLVVLNSSINVVIYVCLGRRFRAQFFKLFDFREMFKSAKEEEVGRQGSLTSKFANATGNHVQEVNV